MSLERLFFMAFLAGCSPQTQSAADSGECPAPPDAGDRCSGDDPGYVFFPALPPDVPADAGTDAADDGGASDQYFTDEACRAFLDQEIQGLVATDMTSRTPSLTSPTDGQDVPKSSPLTFTWMKGPGARRDPLQRVLDLIESPAYAHGFTTGDAFVLEIEQGCNEIVRVMLETTSYTPDAATWARISAVKGPMTATVTWAKWVQNGVAAGTNPAASKAITFTMAP